MLQGSKMTGACSFRKLCKTKGVQSQIYKTCSQRKDSGHIKTLFNLDLPLSIMYVHVDNTIYGTFIIERASFRVNSLYCLYVVVIWSNLLGDIQRRRNPVSWYPPTEYPQLLGGREETGKAKKCGMLWHHVRYCVTSRGHSCGLWPFMPLYA